MRLVGAEERAAWVSIYAATVSATYTTVQVGADADGPFFNVAPNPESVNDVATKTADLAVAELRKRSE